METLSDVKLDLLRLMDELDELRLENKQLKESLSFALDQQLKLEDYCRKVRLREWTDLRRH